MTNPTSNFGWQMPTPTDLVTDLPADFEVFGQAVDTSMADLKGGTTGQILSKATNTDMDFTWITNDVGDITAVNVTSPITGGGSSGAVTIGINAATTSVVGAVQLSDSTSTTSSVLASTPTATKAAYDLADGAIAKSVVTTAGDIIYRNATVPARLGIGTAGQVLAVNSGATAPEWIAAPTSGGMTLLSTTTLSGTSTSVTVAPTGYKNLVAYIYGAGTASVGFNYNVRINGITASTYNNMNVSVVPAGTRLETGGDTSAIDLNQPGNMSVLAANTLNAFNLTFWDCNSTLKKLVTVNGTYINNNSVNVVMSNSVSVLAATSAITNITVIANQSLTSGTIEIYGVK
jgi:hypothetical protein